MRRTKKTVVGNKKKRIIKRDPKDGQAPGTGGGLCTRRPTHTGADEDIAMP
jgi:hypothetical protein